VSRFVTPLKIEQTGWRNGRPLFITLAPLLYESDLLGTAVVVPAGFITDLASTPRMLGAWLLAGGRAPRPAVLHDYPYQFAFFLRPDCEPLDVTKALADAVFYEAMRADPMSGTNAVTAWLMWAGVRLGGRGEWESINRVRELNPEWARLEQQRTGRRVEGP
jgi:hypothetical protein